MERRDWVHLHVFLAAEAPVGALIRTGSDRLAQMILWDTETDDFEPGQWLRAHVAPATADISPDGELFVYEAFDPRKKRKAQAAETLGKEDYNRAHWTAISRPPYWTALDMWFHSEEQNGGGQFKSNTEVVIHPDMTTAEQRPDQGPDPLAITNLALDQDSFAKLWLQRKIRDGWRILHDPRPKIKKMDGPEAEMVKAKFHPLIEKTNGQCMLLAKIGDDSAAILNAYATDDGGFAWRSFGLGLWHSPKLNPFSRGWVDLDQQGRLVWVEEGCLYAWGAQEPTLLYDAHEAQFEPIASPDWARQWPME